MAKGNKFGAFGGVFTPSILTILGVIMYMRLGWVVGEAGLISAIIIIVISHVISISTGLSISSVATDKKIKTGGIYYILSRSLGFPMGGAIGLALFTGTALSISLYLVGFAESFLSVDALRDFFHLEQNINGYRIIASIFLLFLVIIAFISTSLAIKSQYFILGAIALSLVSICIGFFTNTSFAPASVTMVPREGGVSLAVVFGIFFPAVTGFTAGVAMSGDLKDPKKAIPSGTLAAIAVGFVVYIGLAIIFAFFINRDLLVNDVNFLMKIAWFSPLVLAGIWGATLSSALGGILGGPRILQAISKDKITPAIFGKGYGDSNEPRNALILIFLIAEAGILIGELNVIAGVVSMFYLASYGFINIAFFLESWASTDFRPSFRVSKYFGFIGFIASFGVMFQLDMISMFIALFLMFGIYLWLSRKHFRSEFGDVWQSVGLSVVRFVLHKMDKKIIEERNWQPNIILFSGSTNKRPHLIEFGKALVGKFGMMSNFDLFESEQKKYLFPKHLQSATSDEILGKGIFTRRQTCSDIYRGIETIVSTYGFSGIEPNTVLMGWARQSSKPKRFTDMLNRLSDLDVNVLMIDYDRRFGYGKYKTIDIWWRGSGHHGNLSLSLMKFLWSSDEWRDAKLRLMIVNPVNDEAPKIREKAEQVIDNMRINAETKIINNQIEQKAFYDIIRTESLTTDLILLGIPKIEIGKETEFVEETDILMKDIGTVVLVKASSQFKSLSFGMKRKYLSDMETDNLNLIISEKNSEKKLELPKNTVAAENLQSIYMNLNSINNEIYHDYLSKIFQNFDKLSKYIETEINEITDKQFELIKGKDRVIQQKKIISNLDKLIKKLSIKVRKFKGDILETNKGIYKKGIDTFMRKIDKILFGIPDYLTYSYNKQELMQNENDNKADKKFKRNKRFKLKISRTPIKYKVKYKKLINSYLPVKSFDIFEESAEKFGMISIQYIIELQKFIKTFRNTVLEIQKTTEKEQLSDNFIAEQKKLINQRIENIKEHQKESAQSVYTFMQNKTTELINSISCDLKNININSLLKRPKKKKKITKEFYQKIKEFPNLWYRTQHLMLSAWRFELKLIDFENKLHRISRVSIEKIENVIAGNIFININKTNDFLNNFSVAFEKDNNTKFQPPEFIDIPEKEAIFLQFKEVTDFKFEKLKYLTAKFPEKLKIITNEAYNDIFENQYNKIETVELLASGFIDFLIQSELHSPMLQIIDVLPDKIIDIDNKRQNVIRLISFSFFNSKGELINSKENKTEKIINFIKEQTKKLNKLENETNALILLQNRKISERLNAVANKLNVYSIVQNAGNFKQYINRYGNTRPVSFIKNKFFEVRNFSNSQINQLWYRHSEAILLKKSIEESRDSSHNKVNDTLDLLDNVSISPKLLQKLPFYYQQLFLRTHNFNSEFWFGRKQELGSIQKTIERYNSGYYGAVIISGERFSGKTFFANYAVGKFLPKSNIYNINPPAGGSVSINIFKSELSKVFNLRGSFDKIFSKIPDNTVLIIDDLELWWEKSSDGSKVIEQIVELIDNYADKCLFIINVNTYSFKLINKIVGIETRFLNIIKLNSFNAEQLKEIVLFRHNSSGLTFRHNNRKQENMKQTDYAKLFAKHFNYSHGNIGITLMTWMSGIHKFENNTLHIKTPQRPNTNVLDSMDTDLQIILIQFILHRGMSFKKLQRVSLMKTETLKYTITYLKRSGIIIEESQDVFSINRFLYIHIKQKLEEIEMI